MNEFNIRRYVEWLTLVPLLVMAVCLETYFLHDRFTGLENDLQERGKLIARQLAATSEYGIFSDNRDFLHRNAQAVLQQPDLRGVIILSATAESLSVAGEFSDTTKAEVAAGVTASNPAKSPEQSQLAQSRITNIIALVNRDNPLVTTGEGIWIYQPIMPLQVSLSDLEVEPAALQVGAVIIELSCERTDQIKSQMLWATIGVTTLFLIIVFFLVHRASRSITSPIRELSEVVQRIGQGQLEARVSETHCVAELNSLAHGINTMSAQLQRENVSLHRQVEEATRIAAIAFESHEGMAITDANGVILRINSAFTKITGYSDAEAVGQTNKILKSDRQDEEFYNGMWESIFRAGSWQGEIWNCHKNGEVYPAWLTITEVKNEDGKIVNYVSTYTDITLRKVAETEIRNLAFYDALTHLPNRRMLIDRLNLSMTASKRSGRFGALMFIDLDNFKPLNDKYGHGVGDLLLIEVARRLGSCVREVDTVARFGGDEFVVLLSQLNFDKTDSVTQASIVAEKIRDILSDPYVLETNKKGSTITTAIHHCTSSIGVVTFLDHDEDAEAVLKQADQAMYRAKREGRDSIRFYD